jgi:hypothetical protein
MTNVFWELKLFS